MAMLYPSTPKPQSPLRQAISDAYRMDEAQCVNNLLHNIAFTETEKQRIFSRASELVSKVRDERLTRGGMDAFMYEYDLSSEEGIALMCLAEALLRIPDNRTIDQLIRDKITSANWKQHVGKSESFFVNAATWALMLTGKMYSPKEAEHQARGLPNVIGRLIERSGEPFVRKAVAQAVKILSKQFVMGRTIQEALKRAKEHEAKGYLYSYDMLGEAARTEADAQAYLAAYRLAITEIGKAVDPQKTITQRAGISVKLSALHPRYELSHYEQVFPVMVERLLELAVQAKEAGIGFTVDAEESDRLDFSLDIMEAVFTHPKLAGWEGFGLALQSYQKRAWYVIDWLADLARRQGKRFMVRLIKGAYWDTEIKMAQELGLADYPVFTRKPNTDVSYLACAKKIISMPDAFYPQFATHNARTVASVLEMMGERRDFEFQCLHGMGKSLYDQIVGPQHLNIPCRIYAPVGGHKELLSYLVRRLLENGANSSFVNRIADTQLPISELVADPINKVKAYKVKAHPQIPLPVDIMGQTRKNSCGVDISHIPQMQALSAALEKYVAQAERWQAGPIINGKEYVSKSAQARYSPNDRRMLIGYVEQATPEQVEQALKCAHDAWHAWDRLSADTRAERIEQVGVLIEQHRDELMAILICEGGKTLNDAIAEVREAADFCYYYAQLARKHFAKPFQMPGPTGESNQLFLQGRGIMGCISPWNFPLAIFTGQVVASLAAGNAVIAKPAAQTPLVAAYAVRLMHQAGIPGAVVQLLPGRGSVVGAKLVEDQRISGILFTGSTETARGINQTLAQRSGPIVPFIAETGGQNAMIVDSSALPEQVVMDVIRSAFGSAGQRCSALRVLFIQQDVADKIIEMLVGAMQELRLGHSSLLCTDVGPVIDEAAREGLQAHAERMQREAKLLYQVSSEYADADGVFFAPRAFEIQRLSQLTQEEFGPILHVIRYKASELDKVIEDINATGYGLTLGIHSRIAHTAEYIRRRVHVGNIYINRNMIGAVVGVQPFGGEGLSGTGPKAGGPHYLFRLATERTVSINTTAAGGNASLMSLNED
ncbi:MAG: bifunctional proline dehydrogenase/L-glutamate gamma-semialdehyde dehydrogenase PutA [Gammaproteobacteria bacterium]